MTTEEIISHIKRRISIPTSQIKYQNSDFIAFLNNAMTSKIVPKIIDINEGFFTDYDDIPLAVSVSKYRIPKRAVCWTMDEIGYVDTNGYYRCLPRISRGTELVGDTNNRPIGFYIQDGYIITTPSMGTSVSGSLRIYYYRRLNNLKLASTCGQINTVTSVGANYQLTVDSLPTGIANGVDVINGYNPYEIIATEQAATVVGLNITIPQSGFDSIPQEGDWIAETGYTPIPHLPDAWHYVLADFGARKALIGNVDQKTLNLLDSDIKDDLDGIRRVTQTRAKGSPRKRVSRNPFLAVHR